MSGGVTRRAALAGAAAALTFGRARAATATTLLVSHPSAALHDPGPGQWDRPARTQALERALTQPRFAALSRENAPLATRDALLRVHTEAHLHRLEEAAPNGDERNALSPDVVMNGATLEAALRGAGGATLAVDAVMRGAARNAFVATRPPGHHARAEAAMGFCFFNNAAIAVRHALSQGAGRVAIVDFDVHHGNGVQEIFWSEKRVLYASTHQTRLYPGTGALGETGGHDNIVNAPLRKGDGGETFRAALGERILPRVDAFAPDLVIICSGFDAHVHDPLGGLRLVEEDFRDVTLRLMEIAARRCSGRIVSLLEGGYNPGDLAASVATHVNALMEA
jgi:acetoin utilization deacetylase AcuC-like enzyme